MSPARTADENGYGHGSTRLMNWGSRGTCATVRDAKAATRMTTPTSPKVRMRVNVMVAPSCHDGGLEHAAVRALAFHAGYRCRHAGACCTSNWPIPIEADRLLALQAGLASGRVRAAAGDGTNALHVIADAPPDAPAILGRSESRCVFHDCGAATGGRCRIHTALGHDALPLACRQFPRVSLVDPRGVSVT